MLALVLLFAPFIWGLWASKLELIPSNPNNKLSAVLAWAVSFAFCVGIPLYTVGLSLWLALTIPLTVIVMCAGLFFSFIGMLAVIEIERWLTAVYGVILAVGATAYLYLPPTMQPDGPTSVLILLVAVVLLGIWFKSKVQSKTPPPRPH